MPQGAPTARAWDRLHPRLTRRSAWSTHEEPLPIITGTVIRLEVDHLPSGGEAKPVWLWWSGVDSTDGDVDRCWQASLRRFDLEHTFRLFKQTLGWTTPKLRELEAADRWTWLILACHTQLRLDHWPPTSDDRGNAPHRRNDLSPPGCNAGFATSARRSRVQPVHQNPPGQAPDYLPARPTADEHPATTSDAS